MTRFAFTLALLALATASLAQEPAPKTAGSLADKVRQDPDDTQALNAYFMEQFQTIYKLLMTDVDKAEKSLEAFKERVATLAPTKDDAKTLVQRGKSTILYFEGQIEVARTKLSVLEEKLKANADDAMALSKYMMKVAQEASANMGTNPEAAKKQLASARDFLTNLRTQAKAESQTRIDQMLKALETTANRADPAAAQAKLVGQKAAPLAVESWVNGSPLTDDDLKGKVVLLDFWAVWCGPCIATFPHLREWNEKYADKGLVMIGLTKYYNFDWDETNNKAKRSEEKVTPEQERAMLEKFAAENKLTHRFGIQKEDILSKYYGVNGIPQVVVIDREGIIRLIKVGSGEANATAIGEMLEKLVEPAKNAGE